MLQSPTLTEPPNRKSMTISWSTTFRIDLGFTFSRFSVAKCLSASLLRRFQRQLNSHNVSEYGYARSKSTCRIFSKACQCSQFDRASFARKLGSERRDSRLETPLQALMFLRLAQVKWLKAKNCPLLLVRIAEKCTDSGAANLIVYYIQITDWTISNH